MFEDHYLDLISCFLEPQTKLKTLQLVNKDWFAFAWNPEYWPKLTITGKSAQSMRLIANHKERASQLFTRLKYLKLSGPADESLFAFFLNQNLASLERIELETFSRLRDVSHRKARQYH